MRGCVLEVDGAQGHGLKTAKALSLKGVTDPLKQQSQGQVSVACLAVKLSILNSPK